MSESLNLEEAKNNLIRRALLKFKTQREAAEALGCSSRHLINKLKEFKIKRDNTL
jgi:DNA-binding NtrC family response regulator